MFEVNPFAPWTFISARIQKTLAKSKQKLLSFLSLSFFFQKRPTKKPTFSPFPFSCTKRELQLHVYSKLANDPTPPPRHGTAPRRRNTRRILPERGGAMNEKKAAALLFVALLFFFFVWWKGQERVKLKGTIGVF